MNRRRQPVPPPPAVSNPKFKFKALLYTAIFAACTITGTFYGAGLKTQQEWKTEKQKVQQATIDERIYMLESRKSELLKQKNELESKIGEIRKRIDAAAASTQT
ncbi:hypothetical protein QBC38DRAFT_490126 [Podospora fimiseda]|uniref:Uncharacterized protein n=1 Tax=Podospora fimiseda TaxID=252190 RepID=A0AAN7BE30_9PEZI|nr:hypothetical protein QBC38DRAFT_490126 [Podospora fimiseda]